VSKSGEGISLTYLLGIPRLLGLDCVVVDASAIGRMHDGRDAAAQLMSIGTVDTETPNSAPTSPLIPYSNPIIAIVDKGPPFGKPQTTSSTYSAHHPDSFSSRRLYQLCCRCYTSRLHPDRDPLIPEHLRP
jgi:hypothetical protein